MIHYPYRKKLARAEGTATTLRRCVILSSAPRDARWPIATHHPVVPSPLFPSVTHFPSSLLSAARLRPGATNTTLAVVAVHGLAVGARPFSASQLVPSALVRTAADLPSGALGHPRRPVPTTVGSSNKCGTPAIPKSSETAAVAAKVLTTAALTVVATTSAAVTVTTVAAAEALTATVAGAGATAAAPVCTEAEAAAAAMTVAAAEATAATTATAEMTTMEAAAHAGG